jgi:hypothetical protein
MSSEDKSMICIKKEGPPACKLGKKPDIVYNPM